MTTKRIALIPAYEPDHTLLTLLNQLKAAGYDIVVVDDGSNALSEEIFFEAKLSAVVLRHEKNRGKGAALKTGLKYIDDFYGEDAVVVTMDADGQHTVRDAARLCGEAESRPEALILGSRSFKGDVPLRSRFGNKMTCLVYRIFTGQKVQDTQTGLRAFSVRQIPALLEMEGERYEYEMNVLMNYAKQKIPMIEVPIETIYLNDNASSHFNALKDSARIYKEILKFCASSFVSFLVDYVLYALLLFLTAFFTGAGSILIANVGARIISAAVNYTINKNVVFESKGNAVRSAIQYAALAAFMLAVNTALLSVLVNHFDVNRMFAKLVVEASLFIVNFVVQRTVIFPAKERRNKRLEMKEAAS